MIDADQLQNRPRPRAGRSPASGSRPQPRDRAIGKDSLAHLPPSLQHLLREHRAPLRKALERRFGGPPPDPDDAIQTAILKFLEMEGRGAVRNIGAFLFALARNLMLDEIRHMKVRSDHIKRELTAPSLSPALTPATPETILLNKERFRALNAGINSLPEGARTILMLSRIENMPYTEISRHTGYSTAFISRSIQKSMKALSEHMKQNGWETE